MMRDRCRCSASDRVIWVAGAEAALCRKAKRPMRARRISPISRRTSLDPTPGVVLVFDCIRYEFDGEDKARIERVQKFLRGDPRPGGVPSLYDGIRAATGERTGACRRPEHRLIGDGVAGRSAGGRCMRASQRRSKSCRSMPAASARSRRTILRCWFRMRARQRYSRWSAHLAAEIGSGRSTASTR